MSRHAVVKRAKIERHKRPRPRGPFWWTSKPYLFGDQREWLCEQTLEDALMQIAIVRLTPTP